MYHQDLWGISKFFHSHDLTRTCSPGMYWVLPWECVRNKGGIIGSAIERWSDCIGLDRDSCHLGTLSTILQHLIHKMKPSEPLLLTDVTLHRGMYPAGKVDISQHLTIPRFPQWDNTVGSPVQMLVYCVVKHNKPPDLKSSSNVSLKCQPPICLDYRACNKPQL